MTITKTYKGDNIKVTVEFSKDLKLNEDCPCDECLVVCVEDRLLLHLREPILEDALPV